jgi:tetratricopeptide (TPR) repeat protein
MGSGETTRYEMHELVRQYAAERLLETGQAQIKQVRDAHLEFYLSIAERVNQFIDTEKEWEWLERLEMERINLHTALQWATEQTKTEHALRLNAALHTFWLFNSTADEAIDWLESSLSLEWDEQARSVILVRAQVLKMAGYAALQISDLELAGMYFQEAVELFSKLEDQLSVAWSLRGSGTVCLIRGDLDYAQNYMQESWDICQEIQSKYSLAWAAYGLGNFALASANLAEAESLFEIAISHFRQHGRELGIFHTLISLGHLRRAQGKMAKSTACYMEALSIQQRTRYIHYVAQILEGLAHIEVANKNLMLAVQLFGAGQARRDTVEMVRWAHHEVEYQHSLTLTRDQLPALDWQEAWEKGYNMAPQNALELAITNHQTQ